MILLSRVVLAILLMYAFPITRDYSMAKNKTLSQLKQDILAITAAESARFAVAFRDLDGGDSLYLDADTLMHAASTMKVAVMIEVFRQAHLGHFRIDDSLQVHNRFASIVDGQPYAIDLPEASWDATAGRLGQKMPIRELVLHMITVSSNLATNLLIDHVGAASVQKSVRALGADKMQVLRGVEDPWAYEKGLNNTATARDLSILLEAIAQHRVVDAAACEEMIGIMLQQKYRDGLPAQLPAAVKVASKSGSITRICHDAGILFLPDGRRYVLVVLSRGEPDRDKSAAVIARLSRLVYDYMATKEIHP